MHTVNIALTIAVSSLLLYHGSLSLSIMNYCCIAINMSLAFAPSILLHRHALSLSLSFMVYFCIDIVAHQRVDGKTTTMQKCRCNDHIDDVAMLLLRMDC